MVDHIPEPVPTWVNRDEFPFRSRFLETSHGRVHYVDEGLPGAAVTLLVHGTPTWSFEYRHVIAALSRTRRVIAFDHLGFGLSARPRDFTYTPDAHGEVLCEVIERLGLARFAIVLHDYAGPIALPLLLAKPERISKLVVMNSWLSPLIEEPALARSARLAASWLGRFLYCWLNASLRVLMPYGYADKRKLTPSIHAQYLAPFRRRSDRGRVLWQLARALSSPGPSLTTRHAERGKLATIPALIVWGLCDRALPPSVLRRLRQDLPQANVAELAGVGHFPLEEAPADVTRLLEGFLPT